MGLKTRDPKREHIPSAPDKTENKAPKMQEMEN